MLKLEKICKIYATEDVKVTALDNINLAFRNKEFVSILGTSGSGKTTLLNIIGGLDNYTDGNLIIDGKETARYTDNDWDVYRNHKVGFVFQSYNLIPHQNALANVELALTLSGVNKEERRKRAIEALKSVGLEDHIYKKPSQMSGGQTQRIAIARALVNNPDIILADEPTGALDSETSIQIMNILKEVAKTRLVIMVTHNPDLAKEYSTRIIQLKDGQIISDSNPFDGKKESNSGVTKKSKKNFMSFKTALGLSLNNLKTKKARTILTSFAGAIGIIGIALVLSISSGVENYISSVEEDTLSSYPITLEAEKVDATSMLEAMSNKTDDDDHEENTIETNDIMSNMLSLMSSEVETNDLKSFKAYYEKNQDKFSKYLNAVQYSYNLDLQIYKNDLENVTKLNPSSIIEDMGFSNTMYSSFASSTFTELLDNNELLNEQYEVVAGKMPENYDEVVLILDSEGKISDYTAYSIGLKDQDELKTALSKIAMGESVEFEKESYSYDDILNTSFKVLLNTDYYKKKNGVWQNMENDNEYIKKLLKDALDIKIVGIIKPSDDSVISTTSSYGSIGYLKDLTSYVIKQNNLSKIAEEQKNNKDTNILTGIKFGSVDISNLSKEQKEYLQGLSSAEYTQVMNSYTVSYDKVLESLGIIDVDNPSYIYLYPKDFESKDELKSLIDDYNDQMNENNEDDKVISYTDYVGLLMGSVTTIVNVISYVLIAFVSVSLIVSSIMIGIITYISVLERTKEIGILRAIGASKKDISRVFNAETFIIGLLSGLIGIGVTLLLNIPINIIIYKLVDIKKIASLPTIGAIVLIIISVILTTIAGLIPSKMASKKDPVEALRSE